MRTWIYFILAIIPTWAIATPATFQKEMAKFDQTFIPVQFYVSQGAMEDAKGAVIVMKFQWDQLRNRAWNWYPSNDWKASLDCLDSWVGDAMLAIDANNQAWALAHLDRILYEWMDLRYTYRIPYYLDELYDFQFSWRSLLEQLEEKPMNNEEWRALKECTEITASQWYEIALLQPEPDIYGISKEGLANLKLPKQELTLLLSALVEDVFCEEYAAAAQRALRITEKFNSLLHQFGRFSGSGTYYATNKNQTL